MVKKSNNDESKNAIVQTAKTLFQRFGYKKTSVNDIAKALGKVKSVIYYYFPDKESLLRAVIDEEVGKLIWSIDDAVKKASTPEEKLRAYALSRTLEIERLSREYARFQQEYDQLFPLIKEVHQRYDDFERTILKRILEDGMERGVFQKTDAELLAGTILLWLKGVETQLSSFENEKALREVVEHLAHVLLFGIKVR
jgi:AcrR family transcriptional regulator